VFRGDQRFSQLLREFRLAGNIHAMLLENFFAYQRLQQIVDIVAAEMGIAVGGEHFEDSIITFRLAVLRKKRNLELRQPTDCISF